MLLNMIIQIKLPLHLEMSIILKKRQVVLTLLMLLMQQVKMAVKQ